MIVGKKYVSSEVDARYDTIVIGSGLGGLSTAAIMAKAGRKVLVLERHYTAGGFTHSFKRRGYEWDVGVHYLGDVHKPGSPVRRLFDFITDGRLQWAKMDPVYDRIVVAEKTYDYVAGAKNFRAQMLAYFPHAKKEIDTYLSHVRAASGAFPAEFGQRMLPSGLRSLLGGRIERTAGKYFRRTTKQVLADFIGDPKLAGVLCGQWGDYGSPPGRSAFAMHAVVVQHYLDGGNFPVGGASQIAHHIEPVIERAGGSVRTQAEVEQIIVRNGRALGVRMANGDEILADQIVSATGVFNTWSRLLPAEAGERHAIPEKLARLKPAIGHLGLYLGIRGSREELGLEQANLWVYRGYDHDAELAKFVRRPNTDFAVNYISFPSAKDPAWSRHHPGKSTIDVISPIPYEWFRKWQRKPWNERGADYQAYKQQLAEKLLQDVCKHVPQVRGRVDTWELSTPLSTEHFGHYANGPLYGLEHSVERFAQSWITPRTPIDGLFLTGQDVLCCGVASALMSGAMTAGRALGPAAVRVLPELVAHRQPRAAWLSRLPGMTPRASRQPADKLAAPDPLPRSFEARCVEVVAVTHDVKALRFVDTSGVPLPYKPGQFVTLEIDIDGRRHQRSYSLSSSPTTHEHFELTVKRVAGGVVSNWLCDAVEVGDMLTMTGAHGRFGCAPHPREKLLMLSAGSGVTPMLAMSRWIAAKGLDTDVVFFHCARSRQDVIFGDEIGVMAQRKPRFAAHLSLTREGMTQGWQGLTGYLDRPMLERIAPDHAQRAVYVCGPQGFMSRARALFEEAGFPMNRYHEESFASPKAIPTSGGNIRFTASGKTLPCASLQTLLEAAEAGGIRIANACRTGDCGECKVLKVSGEVVMANAAGLDPGEAEDGAILSCVAYADGDAVVEA